MTSSNLNKPTLVLNSGWQPITIASVRKSVIKVCTGLGSFLEPESYLLHDFDSWLALDVDEDAPAISASSGLRMRVPEIIVLKSFSAFPHKQVKLTRRNLLIRDNFRCQYSGQKLTAKEATIDHIMPQSRGGKHTWENVVISAVEVNSKKAERTPEEAGMSLLSKPVQPKWSPIYSKFSRVAMTGNYPESWRHFIKQKDTWTPEDYWDEGG